MAAAIVRPRREYAPIPSVWMRIRMSELLDELRRSLFMVPLLFVLGGGVLAWVLVTLDESLHKSATTLPFVVTATVGSAREVLGTVAAATVTVAGIAFSVSLLVIQQASAQYSPRVVQSLFRDPFNRRVVGLAVGTFTYCLLVLRTIRSSDGLSADLDDPVVPNLAVSVSVLLGVASILAIVAFIDHNARSMEVSQILGRVSRETHKQIEHVWAANDSPRHPVQASEPSGPGHHILFESSGWVQRVDIEAFCGLLPDGGIVRLDTDVGRYAVEGTPLCTMWPGPADDHSAASAANSMIRLGRVRTIEGDPAYGIRQLVDVALVALSPGVNDPTTAQEAIFHLSEVLRAALATDLPSLMTRDDQNRAVLRGEQHTVTSLVDLSFDEIRRASSSQPTVCVYLLEALHLVHDALLRLDRPACSPSIRRQASLVLAGAEEAGLLSDDLDRVRTAYSRRFDADQ
jgi:uncharacterized membrane protein